MTCSVMVGRLRKACLTRLIDGDCAVTFDGNETAALQLLEQGLILLKLLVCLRDGLIGSVDLLDGLIDLILI